MSEIAWAAGLFEGEGSIRVRLVGPGEPVVQLYMATTEQDVLQRFAEIVGVGYVAPRAPYKSWKSHWKPQWHWNVTMTRESADLLRQFLPWLGERRRARALEALAADEERWRTCFCGRHYYAQRPERQYCSLVCKRAASHQRRKERRSLAHH